ncbi:class I SAM-dependent methyltransferase [Alicyclobacillus sp. SO9]|uniref:class I SAM-dependent methyltransferase n=1 Tax=Alicyclobacillus sp. SO9 TaxID=2665646 RepID=UPI0018E811C2|nr:class I SAM-dependent methyltransferase [Alicyclobacillus sp. SO9]QQE76947.1 class I SAM-dependent methyltransferase [Alicyclobacillus sp. SO9]
MVEHPHFSRAYIMGQHSLERFVGGIRSVQNHRANGKTLIVGAGTGLDVPQLGHNVSEVLLLEPDATMRDYLSRTYPELPVLSSPAEHMAAESGVFDTVVSSLVLCSVQSIEKTLSEISRVLRPGGQYLFMEHVLHHTPINRLLQNFVNPLWKRAGGGCNLNRDVYSALQTSSLRIKEYSVKKPNFIAPIISGRALKER